MEEWWHLLLFLQWVNYPVRDRKGCSFWPFFMRNVIHCFIYSISISFLLMLLFWCSCWDIYEQKETACKKRKWQMLPGSLKGDDTHFASKQRPQTWLWKATSSKLHSGEQWEHRTNQHGCLCSYEYKKEFFLIHMCVCLKCAHHIL